MINLSGNQEQEIFRKGSTTYYFSSQFFPRHIRQDVFRLYSFVRIADDYVDKTPPDTVAFAQLRRIWASASGSPEFDTRVRRTDSTDERVVKNMMHVMRTYAYDPAWVEAFLDAMQSDLDKKTYTTIEDTVGYMYGSAEVIGLMMARIMGLPPPAESSARFQGRAMQFINFLRDIDEDNELGRAYLPAHDLRLFDLPDIKQSTAKAKPENFRALMRYEIDRYREWQAEADKGFRYVPRRLRIPLQTAVDMYNWTAEVIADEPFVVFDRKVKPRKRRVISRAVMNGGQFFVLRV